MLTDAWKCVSQISPLADMQHQLRGNTAIKNKWPFVFLLRNISKLIDWGRSLHPKTKLKSSSPENYSNSNWSSLIYLLKAKLFSFWPERTLVGEKKSKCVGNRHAPHIQRKSQHFLLSFPLLSPGCFPVLPTSLPLCLPFFLSWNPVIFASSMFVHFCGFRKI